MIWANLEAIAELIELDILQHGFVLLKGIDTSTNQHLLDIAQTIGSTDTGIDLELIGPLVMDLHYNPLKIKQGQRPAYYTRDAFPMHTDLSYVKNPPRFILMHCIQSASDGEGLTLLSNCSLAFKSLPEHFQNILTQQIFRFSYPPNCSFGQSQKLAVYEHQNNKEIWRFRRDSMSYDRNAFSAVQAFENNLDKLAIKLILCQKDLLIIDNHKIAHGRTAFEAKDIDLGGRYIRRVYSKERDKKNWQEQTSCL